MVTKPEEIEQIKPDTDLEILKAALGPPKKLNEDEKFKAYEIIKSAYKMILKRPFEIKMISSLEAFLKLLGLDTELFLIDVVTYRRIYIYFCHQVSIIKSDTEQLEYFKLSEHV